MDIQHICKIVQKRKKKRKTLFIFNANYGKEMELLPVNIDYCLFKIVALAFFLRVRLHGGSIPSFNFFNLNPQI